MDFFLLLSCSGHIGDKFSTHEGMSYKQEHTQVNEDLMISSPLTFLGSHSDWEYENQSSHKQSTTSSEQFK